VIAGTALHYESCPCRRRPECPGRELTCLAVCSLAHDTAAIHPMPQTNRCSHQGYRTAVRCTRLHRLRPVPIFYPNFYPKGQRCGVEVLSVLVTAANWASPPEHTTSLPSWSCGFDSRRPLQFVGLLRFFVPICPQFESSTVPASLPMRCFSSLIAIFEPINVNVRGWWDYPSFYPKCQQP
jgi:hypothetical protein